MPEGDTVFRSAAVLAEALVGRRLTRGELRHPRLSTVDLAGREVVGVRPVGKHLFLRFDGSLSFRSHLRMDGGWQVGPAGARWRRPAHQVRALLVTADKQAVGYLLQEMALVDTAEEDRLVAHLGPDLLDPEWGPELAAEAAARLRADPERELGVALLDQRVMAGLGNVYKSEVCAVLRVTPWSPVSSVDADRVVEVSRDLLYRNRLRVSRNTTGDPRRPVWAYDRTRYPCPRCGGRIRRADQDDRPTYYCPTCQAGPRP
ncbi:DNA-formamidopyrimidine glycosylase family protein [Actinokineospora sp. UTMC 2448]|uniref:DNA-formamidopyrimidine glycosylase family protein n=1 Tax=Actinokineospora sp. UTMC 2448 TaxID=2268449 RepID=UPI0021640C2E|nr:DNA-formamidopyrimidine glycosylase family protein [Actinokineospora sp. UTMC 2448]UVS80974.1 DNA glycosylase/AP lyase Nei [Actinokineospora sp. UTMC 2448]